MQSKTKSVSVQKSEKWRKKYFPKLVEKKPKIVKQLFHSDFSIDNLPERLLQLPLLKSFESCHLFVHEKGQIGANQYTCEHGFQRGKDSLPLEDFQRLLSFCQKRKSYHLSDEFSQRFSLLGTFIDYCFSLKNSTLLLLVGRHDFLPPDQHDIENLSRLFSQLPLLLESFMSKKGMQLSVRPIQRFLEQTSYPLLIWDKAHKKIVFQSSANTKEAYQTKTYDHSVHLWGSMVLKWNQLSLHNAFTPDAFHQKRIQLLGELLNTLRHELSNPLFGMDLTLNLIRSDAETEEDKEFLDLTAKNVKRCQMIIDNFSGLYDDGQSEGYFSLKKILDESFILTKSETKRLSVIFNKDNIAWEDPHCFYLNQTWVAQVMFNLMINSAQALQSCGPTQERPMLYVKCQKRGRNASIDFIDNGPGVSEEKIRLLFTPFFTTKRSGVGLGLVFSHELCRRMGGELEYIDRKEHAGACFRLILPLSEEYLQNRAKLGEQRT